MIFSFFLFTFRAAPSLPCLMKPPRVCIDSLEVDRHWRLIKSIWSVKLKKPLVGSGSCWNMIITYIYISSTIFDCISVHHLYKYRVDIATPPHSGKQPHDYGKSMCFYRENSRTFGGHGFNSKLLVITRGYMSIMVAVIPSCLIIYPQGHVPKYSVYRSVPQSLSVST